MAKCSRCGKKGLFLKLDFKGRCSNCAFDDIWKKFPSTETSKVSAPSKSVAAPSAIASTPVSTQPPEKNILVYDLENAHIEAVLNHIRNTPGILQRDLGKNFEMPYRAAIRELLYHMEQQNLIYRVKEKNTYHLYLCGSPSIIDFKMPPRPVTLTPEERYKKNQIWQRKQLADYRKIGIKKVEWSCGRLNGRECPECLAKNGKVYWIDKHPKCPAHVGCTCMLLPVVELKGENIPVTGHI